ncbi:hypothetical protein J6590_086757 [Homalodisca vitripennis]|nr:hypothetical protein J6590_086757 [Homalodisca vitripennis]
MDKWEDWCSVGMNGRELVRRMDKLEDQWCVWIGGLVRSIDKWKDWCSVGMNGRELANVASSSPFRERLGSNRLPEKPRPRLVA